MKLALVNPMFYDLAIDLDTLMVRPDQVRKYNTNLHVLVKHIYSCLNISPLMMKLCPTEIKL